MAVFVDFYFSSLVLYVLMGPSDGLFQNDPFSATVDQLDDGRSTDFCLSNEHMGGTCLGHVEVSYLFLMSSSVDLISSFWVYPRRSHRPDRLNPREGDDMVDALRVWDAPDVGEVWTSSR